MLEESYGLSASNKGFCCRWVGEGGIAVVMNGGMGMALVKKSGFMLASRALSISLAMVTFLRVSQLGT